LSSFLVYVYRLFQDDDGDDKESLAFKILTPDQTNELMGLDVVQIQELV